MMGTFENIFSWGRKAHLVEGGETEMRQKPKTTNRRRATRRARRKRVTRR
jgi:hypothetical protein